MENGMADRKNVEDLEFLEVEDIEEASENIVNSYTSTDNSNSERIHNAGIAKNVEKYTEEDDSLTQERKNTSQMITTIRMPVNGFFRPRSEFTRSMMFFEDWLL